MHKYVKIFEFENKVLVSEKLIPVDVRNATLRDFLYSLERRFSLEAFYSRQYYDTGVIVLQQMHKRKQYHVVIMSYNATGSLLCSEIGWNRANVRCQLPVGNLLDPLKREDLLDNIGVTPSPYNYGSTADAMMDFINQYMEENILQNERGVSSPT